VPAQLSHRIAGNLDTERQHAPQRSQHVAKVSRQRARVASVISLFSLS
jgi:hypothetical protein